VEFNTFFNLSFEEKQILLGKLNPQIITAIISNGCRNVQTTISFQNLGLYLRQEIPNIEENRKYIKIIEDIKNCNERTNSDTKKWVDENLLNKSFYNIVEFLKSKNINNIDDIKCETANQFPNIVSRFYQGGKKYNKTRIFKNKKTRRHKMRSQKKRR
jgi:hypothetical protein